jgi:hypothetical protein
MLEGDKERMKNWAQVEQNRMKNGGMARGAVAVTGHGAKKPARSGGVGRRGVDSASGGSAQGTSGSKPSALKSAPSMLKGVDRRERFA